MCFPPLSQLCVPLCWLHPPAALPGEGPGGSHPPSFSLSAESCFPTRACRSPREESGGLDHMPGRHLPPRPQPRGSQGTMETSGKVRCSVLQLGEVGGRRFYQSPAAVGAGRADVGLGLLPPSCRGPAWPETREAGGGQSVGGGVGASSWVLVAGGQDFNTINPPEGQGCYFTVCPCSSRHCGPLELPSCAAQRL